MPRRSVLVRILQVVSITVVTVLFVALIASAFFNEGKPLSWMEPKGPAAQSIMDLSWPVFLVAGIVGFAVFAGVFIISVKFKERPTDDPEAFPEQIHGRTTLEIGWTILPAIILAGVAVATVITILDLEKRDDDAIRVEVYGQQWWWGYRYDLDNDGTFDGEGDLVTANEMVVPVGREIDLRITSNDVIHSFWIPMLNGKKDAVPGQYNALKLEASEEGTYMGQCTEFCGLSHANMRMLVRAVSPETFDDWVANQFTDQAPEPTNEAAAAGRVTFTQLCAQCHVIDGVAEQAEAETPPLIAGVAPNLTHFMTRGTFAGSIFNLYQPAGEPVDDPVNPANAGDPGAALTGGTVDTSRVNRTVLEAWLRNPPAMKPAAAVDGRGMPNLGLTEEQIDNLVEYLYTLN
jgi:cytochrome c oxidase subunit 2